MDKKLSVEEIIRNYEAEIDNTDGDSETKKEESNRGELSENIYSEPSTSVINPNVKVHAGDEKSKTNINPSDVLHVGSSSTSSESLDLSEEKDLKSKSKDHWFEQSIITYKIFKNEERDKKKFFETSKKKQDEASGSTLVKRYKKNLTLHNTHFVDYHLLKIIVVGDFSVGKTAIIQRYTKNTFSSKYQVTIGTEFSLKELRWDDDTIIKIHFWDIAGQERTGTVTRQFYRSSHGVILVCDSSRDKTYSGLVQWIGNLKRYVLQFNASPVPITLFVNKCDLPSPAITVESLNSLCLDHELDAWYMTSAKTNDNIEEAMLFVIKRALKVKQDADRYASLHTISEENIVLHDEKTYLISPRQPRRKRCCHFK